MSTRALAFAELVSYIEMQKDQDTNETTPVFKLTHLAKLYASRLEELGIAADDTRVHKMRLKERILEAIPDLRDSIQGKDVILMYKQDIGKTMKTISQGDFDTEALLLARVAQIIRRDATKLPQSISGTFPEGSQDSSVPRSLKTLTIMIIDGPHITKASSDDNDDECGEAALTITQLLAYNVHVPSSTTTTNQVSKPKHKRHSRKRETPAAIYLGIKIHAETRKRILIDTFHQMGLCISYDGVPTISTDLVNSVCARYEREGVVCPPILRKYLFCRSACDNLDHNPSSTTASDSFQDTRISIMQHHNRDGPGMAHDQPLIESDGPLKKAMYKLPESYTNVPPVTIGKKELFHPSLDQPDQTPHQWTPT